MILRVWFLLLLTALVLPSVGTVMARADVMTNLSEIRQFIANPETPFEESCLFCPFDAADSGCPAKSCTPYLAGLESSAVRFVAVAATLGLQETACPSGRPINPDPPPPRV